MDSDEAGFEPPTFWTTIVQPARPPEPQPSLSHSILFTIIIIRLCCLLSFFLLAQSFNTLSIKSVKQTDFSSLSRYFPLFK